MCIYLAPFNLSGSTKRFTIYCHSHIHVLICKLLACHQKQLWIQCLAQGHEAWDHFSNPELWQRVQEAATGARRDSDCQHSWLVSDTAGVY